MIYDKRYEDNIVLKRDAFQNLLTQIKNYPIIDIDYVSNENKKDILHDNKIWHAYTDDTPCLKITYGDDRSLKGNIIFAEWLQDEIEQKQEELRNKKIELHNADYLSKKILEAFNQNKIIQEDKELEAERIERIWNTLVNSKQDFLKAGLSILDFPFSNSYTSLNSLGPIDKFETVKPNSKYSDSITYYILDSNNDYQEYINNSDNKIEDWTRKVNNGEIYTYETEKFAQLSPGTRYYNDVTYYYLNDNYQYEIYTGNQEDWEVLVNEGKIYTYIGYIYNVNQASPLCLSKISIYYTDVELDAFTKVTDKDSYDEDKIYYYLDDNGSYQKYTDHTTAKWNNLIDNEKLFESINKENKISFSYTTLNPKDIAILYNELTIMKNWQYENRDGTKIDIFNDNEKNFISNFIDFIIIYNYLTFLQGLADVGFTQPQIDEIKNLRQESSWMNLSYSGLDNSNPDNTYPTPVNIQGLRTIIQQLIENSKWHWENSSMPDFDTIKNTFESNFRSIINTIGDPNTGIIAKNLERLKADYNSNQNTIIILNETIDNLSAEIEEIQSEILNHAGDNILYGYKYVKLGNNIKWSDNFDYNDDENGENNTFFVNIMTANDNVPQPVAPKEEQQSGTFRVQINGQLYEVPIKGFKHQSDQPINMSTNSDINITAQRLIPSIPHTQNIGDEDSPWLNGYFDNITISKLNVVGGDGGDTTKFLRSDSQWSNELGGSLLINGNITVPIDKKEEDKEYNIGASDNYWTNGYFDTIHINSINVTGGSGNKDKFLRSDSTWSNTLEGQIIINDTTEAERKGISDNSEIISSPAAGYNSSLDIIEGSIKTAGGIVACKNIMGKKVHGAVFNDYAEYRHTENIEVGRCVVETGKGDLVLSTKRLQLGGNIISDTYGFSIGETNYANTPIAVCGRVLAYPYEDKNSYLPGQAVCSGPNGTISAMTREEIKEWPDAIIGYISEIPEYETWGSDQIQVNNRIWIKIK